MATKTVTKQSNRNNLNTDPIDLAQRDNMIKSHRAKTSADQKAKLEEKKHESSMSMGELAWNDVFDNDDFNLPETSYMNCLRQAIPHDRFQQIADVMLRTLNDEKEEFCKGTYYTLQDAKKHLYALLTEIMMDKIGYIISNAIEGAKRGLNKLKELKSQVDNYKSIAGTKKAIKDRLIKEMEVTQKALTEALQEEPAPS